MRAPRKQPTYVAKRAEPPQSPVERLQRELELARSERDAALLDLAREREVVNALRLAQVRAAEDVPRYPAGAGLGPVPLRYELIDAANDKVKKLLGPLHAAVKRAATLANKRSQ